MIAVLALLGMCQLGTNQAPRTTTEPPAKGQKPTIIYDRPLPLPKARRLLRSVDAGARAQAWSTLAASQGHHEVHVPWERCIPSKRYLADPKNKWISTRFPSDPPPQEAVDRLLTVYENGGRLAHAAAKELCRHAPSRLAARFTAARSHNELRHALKHALYRGSSVWTQSEGSRLKRAAIELLLRGLRHRDDDLREIAITHAGWGALNHPAVLETVLRRRLDGDAVFADRHFVLPDSFRPSEQLVKSAIRAEPDLSDTTWIRFLLRLRRRARPFATRALTEYRSRWPAPPKDKDRSFAARVELLAIAASDPKLASAVRKEARQLLPHCWERPAAVRWLGRAFEYLGREAKPVLDELLDKIYDQRFRPLARAAAIVANRCDATTRQACLRAFDSPAGSRWALAYFGTDGLQRLRTLPRHVPISLPADLPKERLRELCLDSDERICLAALSSLSRKPATQDWATFLEASKDKRPTVANHALFSNVFHAAPQRYLELLHAEVLPKLEEEKIGVAIRLALQCKDVDAMDLWRRVRSRSFPPRSRFGSFWAMRLALRVGADALETMKDFRWFEHSALVGLSSFRNTVTRTDMYRWLRVIAQRIGDQGDLPQVLHGRLREMIKDCCDPEERVLIVRILAAKQLGPARGGFCGTRSAQRSPPVTVPAQDLPRRQTLRWCLYDASARVRAEAVKAVAALQPRTKLIEAELGELRADPSPLVRRAVRTAIGR